MLVYYNEHKKAPTTLYTSLSTGGLVIKVPRTDITSELDSKTNDRTG